MSLNHEYGELTAYGANFHKVDVSKWQQTNIFDMAYRLGLGIMNKKVRGITRFDPTEIIVQEYHIPGPDKPHLVFFFHKRINGVDFYTDVPVTFPDVTLRELVMAGYWPAYEGPRMVLH